MRIAYFRAEFGMTECFQIYSGGLGILAGDHLKSASELGLPLVGVGLLYRNGYFHQYVSSDGWQQETYPELEPATQPVRRVFDETTGEQMRVHVELAGRSVSAGIWKVEVGRVPLYLLGHQHAREQRQGPRDHAQPLRRRRRDAHPAGDRPRRRRRPAPLRAVGGRTSPSST